MQEQSSCLIDKVCTPCQGGVASLDSTASSKLLLELNNGWAINELGHLYKEYNFNNFIKAMNLANKIAILAEREGHHPDLTISWGKCIVNIWTHKINGLTESDFILAAKINNLGN
jgi:4a-hydroxytetrahydrobiopterin dehydratase